jgi:hypothetical protein
MNEFIELWKRTLGEPPNETQFAIWQALHTPEVIKRGILKTAIKAQLLNGCMSTDHKLRFASKVMSTLTDANAQHARNRERLRDEFGGAR